MAAKKKAAKRPVKKAAAKRPAKRAVKKSTKSSKRPPKKAAAKRPVKKSSGKKSSAKRGSAKKTSAKVDASKIVIPPVPTRGSTTVSSTPAPAKSASPSVSTPAKKNSNGILFLVIAGVVLLAIFALTNSSNDDGAAPKPTASESMSEEPTAEPSESETDEPTNMTYEAPQSFVAINNSNGGVTLRWKAPATTDGLTGYAISLSYDAKNFTEAGTVGADQFTFDVAMAGDEGGTQFLLQAVYEDGTKVDAKKFSLKGKYQN